MFTRKALLLGLCLLSLSACGSLRQDLGLGRSPPDEFAVVDHPPLSIPPDFSLRPPRPGADRPQEIDMTQRANDILFSGAGAGGRSASKSEAALLKASGADHADPAIRDQIDRETAQKVEANPHIVDELLFWKKGDTGDTTVDSVAEAARIKEAQDKGEPVNQGATPIIEKQKSGFLGL